MRVSLSSTALLRGGAVGLAMIVPISMLVEVLERNVDDLEGSGWTVAAFVGVVVAYVVCGRVAGGLAPDAPLSHGALAALISFAGWLAVRVAIPLVQGDSLGFGLRAVITNAMFACAFGLLGGAWSMRNARV
jgi:hypothetical protein